MRSLNRNYIVMDGHGMIISAPSGYARTEAGAIVKDGTCSKRSGPEMTRDSFAAYQFTTLRYAQQQAAKLAKSRIVCVTDY